MVYTKTLLYWCFAESTGDETTGDDATINVHRYCGSVAEALKIVDSVSSIGGSRVERRENFIYCSTGHTSIEALEAELGTGFHLVEQH